MKTPINTAARAPRWDSPVQPFQDMTNDAIAHFTRTDPGQSLPGECRHGYRRMGNSDKFKCPHCHKVFVFRD